MLVAVHGQHFAARVTKISATGKNDQNLDSRDKHTSAEVTLVPSKTYNHFFVSADPQLHLANRFFYFPRWRTLAFEGHITSVEYEENK